MTADRWIEITVHVAPADVDLVATVLADVTGQAVAIEPQIHRTEDRDFGFEELDAPVAVRAYVKPPFAEAGRATIQDQVASLDLSAPLTALTVRELDPADWSEEWKRFYNIQHIGDRLVIRPSWLAYDARDDEVVIDIDPGASFGTGQHETTRLCLAAIDRYLEASGTVIDVGCGSGILAIAAARLGACSVRAVDRDPEAIRVTRENAGSNGVSSRIEADAGSLGADWPWPADATRGADLVIVNITSTIVLELVPAIVGALAPSGRAIVSGFLANDAHEIEAAIEQTGLSRIETRVEGDWACIVAEAPAATA